MAARTRDPLGLTGTVIQGRYAVGAAVGEGGAAIVYRGEHVSAGVPVAIKFLVVMAQASEADRPLIMEEFVREGRLVAELSTRTSAIVQPRDLGVLERPGEPPLPYLVLEWLEGRTLDEMLVAETNARKPPRPLVEAVQMLEPIAGALAIAHEQNVAHRDVKPENLFVVADPAGLPGSPSTSAAAGVRIKLLDFGIAKVMQRRISGLHQTGTLPTAFTPHYGAPEQFSRTYGETGPWTDVFAMALVILEVMQGGRRAFEGDDYMELARQSCDEDRRPTPRTLKHVVSDEVEAVFERALAVQPSHRYPDMGLFWAALLGALDPRAAGFPLSGPSRTAAKQASAPPPMSTALASTFPAPVPRKRRNPIITVAFAGGLLLIVSAAVVAGIKLSKKSSASASASASASSTPSSVASTPRVVVTSASAPTSTSTSDDPCPPGSVVVGGGKFLVGCADPKDVEDGPRHHAFVDSFCLDLTEVTVKAYRACVDAGHCDKPSPASSDAARCNFDAADRATHPMNCVTQPEAQGFCADRGMRLPTEAEWEIAAGRGVDGLPWNAAGAITTLANLDGSADGFDGTAPVGSFPNGATTTKVVDLVGNVAEWVADFYAQYPAEERVNPTGPETGTKRVIRGGSFLGLRFTEGPKLGKVVVTHRDAVDPELRSPAVGFRCAKSL
ncbi:MAG: bifunctional serine/threonine-protein kinase/formylglycine-generating enzyme family protein [Polyangiaceae bacterium]